MSTADGVRDELESMIRNMAHDGILVIGSDGDSVTSWLDVIWAGDIWRIQILPATVVTA